MTSTATRGAYGEISLSSLSPSIRKQVENLVKGAQSADKVDEHGMWEFGAEFDRKGRGYAINWDLYAVGRDRHSKRTLAVIQIRKWEKQYKNGYGSTRKSYFLLGRNEDNTIFAHCVESRVIHAAIKADRDVIKAVQSWIFGADYSKVIRQGDLALIPVKSIKKDVCSVVGTECSLAGGSHLLTAEAILKNGNLYAKNPELHHVPGTHPDVSGEGWYKVVIGKRAAYWSFAAPTID